jgi:L,D-transpeptidase catalytic domain
MRYRCSTKKSGHAAPLPHTLLAAALLASLPLLAGGEAAEGRTQKHRHRPDIKTSAKNETKRPPQGPLFAIVSIADQHVSFYDANGLFARGQVSTGVPGHPTPTGVFTILEKERWHRSNIYSGAPMPFMQRVTWTGVAMHAGIVPGHPASHGCIRLHPDFAKQMFSLTKEGQRVIIAPREVNPAEIMHAHLPAPKLTAPLVAQNGAANTGLSRAAEQVSIDTRAATVPAGASQLLNPADQAKAMKAAAAAKAAEAAQALKIAHSQIDSKLAEARNAAKDAGRAEITVNRAREEVESEKRLAEKAQGEEAVQKAALRKAVAAEAKLAAAEAFLKSATETKAAKDRELTDLQSSIREANAAQAEAAALIKEAARRLEPVSIFISRKAGRLYVRQATQHLFEMPIAIRDPGKPIGTHLIIATGVGADGASLRWVSLTPPAAVEYKMRPRSSRKGRRTEPEEDIGPTAPFPETAAGALDRIELPEEALQRIAPLIWAGATLIVSDVGMSGEGRFAMDFMILGRTRVRQD